MNIIIPFPRDFKKNHKQFLVLDALERRRKKYILYSGAYGAGKTILLCHCVIRMCMKYPKSLWFFGSQTVPMLRDTVVRTFLEEIELYQNNLYKKSQELPEEERHLLAFQIQKQYMSSIMSFKFWNGSEVLFRSCDEPSKFKSLNLDGFALDEPVDIDEEVFLMLQGRLRANHAPSRHGILAGNPAGKTNWVYQRFFEKKHDDYYAVHTTTYDNPFLPPDYIPSMESSFDEDYKRRYLYGEWGSFEGQVYKDFNITKHVGNYIDEECKYHICGFDDGTRNPCCALAIGINSDNEMFIKKEFYEKGLVDSEKTEEIYNMHRKYNFTKIFADPSALSMIESLKNKKLRVAGADNDIDSGVSKLKSFFKNDLIYIDKSCKNLIKELESYRYAKDRSVSGKNITEKPIKKNDHGCDALRYSISEFNPFRKPTICYGGHW